MSADSQNAQQEAAGLLSGADPQLLQQARDFTKKSWERMRPWSEFGNTTAIRQPKTFQSASERIIKNLKHFAPNYALVFIGLIIYCLITSPMLLFAVAVVLLGLAGILHLKEKQPILVAGLSLGPRELGILLFCVSVPLFYFASAGTTVFWLLGVSAVIIVGHAALMDPSGRVDSETEGDDCEANPEQIV